MAVQLEQYQNTDGNAIDSVPIGGMTFNQITFTPTSYLPYPTSGQFRLRIDSEKILITDCSIHPFPISRGDEITTPTAHAAGAAIYNRLTVGSLTNLIGAYLSAVLTATGRLLNFVGPGAGVAASGGYIQVNVPAWEPVMDSSGSGVFIFTPGGDVIVAPV